MTGAELLALIILSIPVGRIVQLLVWPYGPCRRCDGSRHNVGSNQRRWGKCRRCGGTGERRRVGARTVNAWFGREL